LRQLTDEVAEVVDEREHAQADRRGGEQPANAGQPQDSVARDVEKGGQQRIQESERPVADRSQMKPAGEEVDQADAVLRHGIVDQQRSTAEQLVGWSEDVILLELDDARIEEDV